MSGKKITKNDIVDKVHEDTKIEKKVLHEAFDGIIAELKNSLKCGSTIELRGFGTFEPRLRKGREKARNPKTGEILSVEPHFVAAFRAGQELKKALMEMPVEKN